MQITLNKFALDYLLQKNVFANVWGTQRFKEGEVIAVPDKGFCEEYSSFNTGNALCGMGSFSYSNARIPRVDIQMGRYCSIAVGLSFISGKHPLDILSTSSFTYDKNFCIFKKPNERFANNEFKALPIGTFLEPAKMTIFENDVYVCTNALLKPGIRLGTGCVVAQSAIVTKDVPPYAIVAGSPATIRKYRFDESTIQRLLALKWWEYKFTDFKGVDLRLDINAYLDELEALIQSGELSKFEPEKMHFEELIERSKQKAYVSVAKVPQTPVKPLGAVARIKQSLSYQLGTAMIEHSKSLAGVLKLPFVLLKISKNFKKQKAVYEMMIKINESFKRPPLESYDDYNEALSYKEHLRYKLGSALIQCVKEASNNPAKFIATGGGDRQIPLLQVA